MALNTFKRNYMTPLHFKGLKVQCKIVSPPFTWWMTAKYRSSSHYTETL